MTLTANQRIEREKGAKAEREAIPAEVNRLWRFYMHDLIIEGLRDWIKARGK